MEKFREPLRTLIGKFEAEQIRLGHRGRYFADLDDSLWHYFSAFPRKSSPEQFALADSEDWRVWQADAGYSYTTIRTRLSYVKSFFSWLSESVPAYQELPNPVVVPVWPVAHTNPDAPPNTEADHA